MDRVDFAVKNERGFCIISVRGEMDVYNSFEFKKLMDEHTASGTKKFILILGALNYIDSSGLGALINQQMKLQKSGGELYLVSLSDQIRSVLELTKMQSFFRVFSTEAEALSVSSAA